jgi:hypothetical protein
MTDEEIEEDKEDFDFDIALSFAGEDRLLAENLANQLVEYKVRVFYDLHVQAQLWGKDLYQHLQAVYRDKARYCIILVSQSYAKKLWARHELKQAQARAFRESREYILPLRLDDTEIPGLNYTVGYIDLRNHNIEEVCGLVLEKLYEDDSYDPDHLIWNGEFVEFNGMKMAAFWPKKIESAQTQQTYTIAQDMKRIPYGNEEGNLWANEHPCRDCGVLKGQLHVPNCCIDQCPACGGQAISCDCAYQ